MTTGQADSLPGAPDAQSAPVTVERAPWTVSLESDKTEVATGYNQAANLYATANQNTSYGGYHIRIVDDATGDVLKDCTNTSACYLSGVNFYRGAATRSYHAEVADEDGSNVQATSAPVTLTRRTWQISLLVDKEEVSTGYNQWANLYATANQSVGEGGYRIRIIDDTTGNTIKECDYGSGCAANYVNFYRENAHTYHAEVVDPDGSNMQATSNPVTLTRKPWTLELHSDKTVVSPGYNQSAYVYAYANQEIGPGGYHLFLIDDTTGDVLKDCTYGSSCAASYVNFYRGALTHTYHAEVADADRSNVQAVSNSISLTRTRFTVSLSQSKSVITNNISGYDDFVRLSASTNQEVGPGQYEIRIIDETTGTPAATCTSGSNCTTYVWFEKGGVHTYHAEIVYADNPAHIEARSNETASVKRLPWTITLNYWDYWMAPYKNWGYTLNQPLGYGWKVQVFDQTTGDVIHECDYYRGCYTGQVGPVNGVWHDYYARVVRTDDNGNVTDLAADSNGYSANTGRLPYEEETGLGGGNPSANNNQCKCGDPVNTVTGEFYENITDIAIPGRLPLTWTRSYSSSRDTDSGLGVGWTSVLDARVVFPDGAGPIKVVQENGSIVAFWYTNYGQTTPVDTNITATLRNDNYTSGHWYLTRRDGTVLKFNSDGRIVSIADRNGETLWFNRDNPTYPNRVTSISGDAGTLTLHWDNTGHVASVDGPGQTSVAYTYNNDNQLVAVTDALGNDTTYGYDSHNRLDSVTDPEGGTTTNTYDSHGRVTRQEDPLGHDTTFDYDTVGTAGTTSTTVTDPAGRVVKYVYDNGWLAQKIADPSGDAPRVYNYVNGPTGQPVSVTDPLGRTTYMTYNSRGDRTSVTNPAGETVRWTYNEYGDVKTVRTPKGATAANTFDDTTGALTGTTVPLNGTDTAATAFTHGHPAHPGDITTITDPLGNDTTLGYDPAGRLTSTATPGGSTETRTYTAAGLLKTVVDPNGNTTGADPDDHKTTYTYDALGRVTAVTKPDSGTTHFTYDDNSRVTTVTDPAGQASTTTYDAAGRVTSVTNPRGKTTHYGYDPAGLVTSVTTPDGAKTTYTYNVFGEVTTVTSPEGNVTGASNTVKAAATTTFTYDAAGQRVGTSTPNPDGGAPVTTTTTYDNAGRVHATTDPLGATTTYTYDGNGNLTKVTDPDNHDATYTYDKANRVTSVTDPNGHTTTYGYDLASHRVTETSPMGRVSTSAYNVDGLLSSTVTPRGNTAGAEPDDYRTTYTYDPTGNLTTVTDPLDGTTEYGYDNAGRVTGVTDPRGKTTHTTYNNLGLPTAITNPDGGQVHYTYDPAGNVITDTNPLGGVTTYTYDNAGHVASVTDPLDREKTYTYDAAGRLATVDTARGTTSYAYDTLGRTTGVDYSNDTPDVAYTYDRASQRTGMIDGTGTTAYGYDPAGLLTSVSHGEATAPDWQFTYTYDDAGNLTDATGPNEHLTTGYNADGLPTSLTRGTGSPTVYTYNPDGDLASKTLPNGTGSTYTRDPLGQVTTLTHTDGDNDPIATRDYTYDPAGNPTSLTTTRGTGPDATTDTRAWAYDNAGRLTRECDTTGPCTLTSADLTWGYDTAGNITTKTTPDETVATSYDIAGQAVTESTTTGAETDTADYTYDADGNLLDDGTHTYAYDLAGHTTNITTPDLSTTYTYDGDGNRATATTSDGTQPTTTDYVWDINQPLPMLATETTGDTTHTYTYNPDGTPNSIHTSDGTTAATWNYLTDPVGTVTDVTDTTGERVKSYEYTPYGEQRGPPVPDATGAPDYQPFAYTGQYLDPTTGLYNLRARQYDPSTGRFTAADPLNASADALAGNSLYAYANNNPLLYTDPIGLGPWDTFKSGVQWTLETPGDLQRSVSSVSDVAGIYRDLGKGTYGAALALGGTAYSLGQTAVEVNSNPFGYGLDQYNAFQQAYDAGGLGLAINQVNPVYSLLVHGDAWWKAANQGCFVQAGRNGALATLDLASTVGVATGGAQLSTAAARSVWAPTIDVQAAEATAGEAPLAFDPAKRRPGLRVGVKQAIRDKTPVTPDGKFYITETGKLVPVDDFHYGHKPGHEWWRTRDRARAEGWTRQQVIESQQNPDIFRIEDPAENMSHKNEKPR